MSVPGRLEIDVLHWIARQRFNSLLGYDGKLNVRVLDCERSSGNVGSYTTFYSDSLPIEFHSEIGLGILIRFPDEDVTLGCLMLPEDNNTATMEIYVNGEGGIPSFESGYEISFLKPLV